MPILATKLHIPPPRPRSVLRPRLIARLDEGLGHKLTLISAPAGFGKTTLVGEWVAGCERIEPKVRTAWLSLDEGDNEPTRFLAYLVSALQTIEGTMGEGVLSVLQSPQPPPTESILTALLNDITTVPDEFILVLDDYHVIDAGAVDGALTFLIEHLPPQMHLVIATREDPHLPLARLRARGQLIELRAADLRFTPAEAADFLNQVMELNLSAEDVAALETRTEGWVAGLQLAAISMRGHSDAASFIESFTGSHHFVLDYLVEEVLHQQPESVQTFLLCTSILDRLCGPLCDAVLDDLAGSGQETLEYLERANLFLVPLDNERRWYRYHHLFADLLRQRLGQGGDCVRDVAELHIRASEWYEENGLEIEAFQHAAAADDIDRAERLIEGEGMPLTFRGAMAPVMNWLGSLPAEVLDARPSLWVTYATALTMSGQPIKGVEEILRSAEAALAPAATQDAGPDSRTQDLLGQIAANRAMLAIPHNQLETIITQSRRALELLHPDNLPVRTTATWTLGYAYQLQGDYAAASRTLTDVIAIAQASGNAMAALAAATVLGQIQEAENQLHLAAESYHLALELAGEPPVPGACEAYLGLAHIRYEWNDLDAAEQHGQQSLILARQLATVDTPASCELFLTRLKLTQEDVPGALALLANAEQFIRQRHFEDRLPEVAAIRALALLRQGDLAAAAHLAQTHDLPLSQARVHLAQGDASAALTALASSKQTESGERQDERLKAAALRALAHHALGESDDAMRMLGEALTMAQPGGLIRTFVDEGPPMAQLLSDAAARGLMPDYTARLLAAFASEGQEREDTSYPPHVQPLVEPLSERELEVLELIAEGLTNREIGKRLFLALDTVKGHNRRIYAKLQVQRRTEAIARARELGLL